MKRALLCCYLLLFNLCLEAAIPTQTAWEIRPTVGALASGGCFVVGATGTDFSQQNAAQYSGTDLVIDAVTNTKVTSATHNFVAADVGNCLHITAGTGYTTGFYSIASVAANAGTLDRSPGALGLTGGTFAVGGALADPSTAMSSVTAGNIVWVKDTAVLTSTTGVTLLASTTPTPTTPPTQLIGYTTTRGDGGKWRLTLSTNSNLTGIGGTVNGWLIKNVAVDCNTLTNSIGVRLYVEDTGANIKASNCTTIGVDMRGAVHALLMDSEVTGCTAACSSAVEGDNLASQVIRNFIHDNATIGIRFGSNFSMIVDNLVTNNTGATSDGIQMSVGNNNIVLNNTCYGNGRDGIQWSSNAGLTNSTIRNNLLVNNGRYGLSGPDAGYAAQPMYDGNAYFGNITGTRRNLDDTGSINPINASSPYVNVLDVTLTGDPFVNAAGGNFTLNNTAGAGAAARGSGTPGTLAGTGGTGYMPMGALAPAACATSGVVTTSCGFTQ